MATTATRKRYNEKSTGPARMENNAHFEARPGVDQMERDQDHCGKNIHEMKFLCVVKLAVGGPVRESNMGISTRRRAAHDAIDTAHTLLFRCHH